MPGGKLGNSSARLDRMPRAAPGDLVRGCGARRYAPTVSAGLAEPAQ
jgi:hypothetical protein